MRLQKFLFMLFFLLIISIPFSLAVVKIKENPLLSFLKLKDTPASYSGQNSLCVKVNAGEDGVEFGACGGGGGSSQNTDGFFLYNDTNTHFFNASLLNETIESVSILLGFNSSSTDSEGNLTNLNVTNTSNNLGMYIGNNGKVGINTYNLLDTLNVYGDVDIVHFALHNDDHALEIDVHADGYGDVKAIDIDYITGDISLGQDEAVILVNVDDFLSTGGDVIGLEVITTQGGAMVFGMEVGALVHPIEQLSGVFSNMSSALVQGVNTFDNFTDVNINSSIFINDDDNITIGHTQKFEEIEIILDTVASGAGISPSFYFSTGLDTWTEFSPIDGTNGLRNTGVIIWIDEDIPSWATNGSEYLIRIQRTKNNLGTTPIEQLVQIAVTTEYRWDKNGYLKVNNVTASTYYGDGSQLTGIVGGGGNASFNESLTNDLYVDVTGDNMTGNLTLTDKDVKIQDLTASIKMFFENGVMIIEG